jgi:(p)ppGpp synthase/HD superfamily hydrolase
LVRREELLEGPHLSAQARLIASLAHQWQLDAIGAPYWGHLARVAARSEMIRGRSALPFDRYEVESVALLHDVLEDTPVTFDQLRIAGINPRVCQAVSLLTHRGEPRFEYLERIAADPLARLVKIADTLDNTDPVRARSIPDVARRERLAVKYQGQMEMLLAAAGGSISRSIL